MQTYQEYLYFLDRYRHIVFSFVAERLFSYVVYPIGKGDSERKQRDNYKDYSREDIRRFYTKIDGQRKLIVPDGPFDYVIYHIFKPNNPDPVLEINKLGNGQFENFYRIIAGVTDTQFPELIEKYASKDCDCTYTKDCIDTLERKLKSFWKLT